MTVLEKYQGHSRLLAAYMLWSLLGVYQVDLFRKMMPGLLNGLISRLAVKQGSLDSYLGDKLHR